MTLDEFISQVATATDECIVTANDTGSGVYQCTTDSLAIEYAGQTWFASTGDDVWVEAPTLDEVLDMLS